MPVLDSVKDEQFVLAYIKHKGNATEAYLDLNPHVQRNTAAAQGCLKLAKDIIQRRISEILQVQGLSVYHANESIRKALHATKSIQVDSTKQIKEVEDYPTQLQAGLEVLDLHGVRSSKGNTMIIDQSQHLTVEAGADVDALAEIVSRLEKLKSRANDTRVAPVIDVRSIEIEPEPTDEPKPSPTQPSTQLSTQPSVTSSGTVG